MKKIICFLFLTVAFATNAQTYTISGDNTYGNVAVSIIIDGGVPISIIADLQKGQSYTYTVPSGTPANASIEVKAESQDGYVFINSNDDYYGLYLDYLCETGTYFDIPEQIYIEHLNLYDSNYDFFIGTLPLIPGCGCEN